MKTRILTALATSVALLVAAQPSVADPWSPDIPRLPEREVPLRPDPAPAAEPEPVPEAPDRRDGTDWEAFGAGAALGLGAALLLGSSRHGAPARPAPPSGADRHAYCAATYPDYDPATGTWVGADGRRYACR